MRMPPHMALGADPARIAGASVGKGVIRRVWAFAKPYRWLIAGFLLTIVLEAVAGLVPPLLIRGIIDDALPAKDRGAVSMFAAVMVGIAFATALLSFVERWWSSRIGEGLI